MYPFSEKQDAKRRSLFTIKYCIEHKSTNNVYVYMLYSICGKKCIYFTKIFLLIFFCKQLYEEIRALKISTLTFNRHTIVRTKP